MIKMMKNLIDIGLCKQRTFVFFLLFSILAATAHAATYYVNSGTGSNAYDGSSGSPWKTITYAATMSAASDTINVAAGRYSTVEGEVFPLILKNGRNYVGAGSGACTIESGADSHAISVEAGTTINGLKIRVVTSTYTGILVMGTGVQITNCLITSDAIGSSGSGISFNSDTAGANISGTVTSCEVSRFYNGISTNGSTYTVVVTIESNVIHDNGIGINVASGVWSNPRTIYINRNVIRDADTSVYGGGYGIWGWPSHPVTVEVINNTIVQNKYGIVPNLAAVTLNSRNNIVASEIGGKIFTGSTSGEIRGSSTFSSTFDDVYSNDTNWSGVTTGAGTISADALFVDPTNDDYHLSAGSPCIDAGTAETTEMGAYDYVGPTLTVSSPNGGETLTGSSSNNISWASTGYFTSIAFYYSVDNGATYSLITTGEANDGTYSWFVPALNTTEAKVRIVGAGAATVTDESNVKFTISTPPAPTVTSLSPALGGSNQSLTGVAVNGSNFVSGATVVLSKTGQSNINGTSISFVSSSQLTCNLDLTNKTVGFWTVTVTNPDTQTGALSAGFAITSPAPTVTLATPASGDAAGGMGMTITGTNFLNSYFTKEVVLTNSSSEALTNYQIPLTINTAVIVASGEMQASGADIRFLDTDKLTPLPYWIETGMNTSATKIWVKVPSVPIGSKSIFLEHGSSNLTTQSSTTDTFVREIVGLTGHWAFDETSGTSATDSSGLGYTGTLVNTPSWTAAKFNNGLSFNGSSTYVRGPNNADVRPADKVSFGCWGYQSNWATATADRRFISCTEGGGYQLGINGAFGYPYTGGIPYVGALVYRGGSYAVVKTRSDTLSSGWHHFFVTYYNRYTKLYVDGVLAATDGPSGNSPYTITYPNANVIIGAESGGGSTAAGQYYDSLIDEVEIYHAELTSAEVYDLYSNYAYATANNSGKILVKKFCNPEVVGTPEAGRTNNPLQVYFGSTRATNEVFVSSTTLTATTPAHAAGAVNLSVYNPNGAYDTLLNGFTYTGGGASYMTLVGSAEGWSWATPIGGNVVPSGSAEGWSWQTWSAGSGRKVPQGSAEGWSWGDE